MTLRRAASGSSALKPLRSASKSCSAASPFSRIQKATKLVTSAKAVLAASGVVRARAIAKRLDDADLAIIDKRRPRANETQVMNIIGNVRDKFCVLVDDLVDTAGTLCQAAAALKAQGAERVVAYATHAVLSGPAVDNISRSRLDELVVTDTIPLGPQASECPKIRQLSVAHTLAETIRRVAAEESVSSLCID